MNLGHQHWVPDGHVLSPTDHHIQPAARLVPNGMLSTSNRGTEKAMGKRKLRNCWDTSERRQWPFSRFSY